MERFFVTHARAKFRSNAAATATATAMVAIVLVASGCSTHPNTPQAQFDRAMEIAREKPEAAVELLERAAGHDHANAMIVLAGYQRTGSFYRGLGLRKTEASADTTGDYWDRRAFATIEAEVESGGRGAISLGFMYAVGRGVEPDTAQACNMMLRAMDTGEGGWFWAQKWCPQPKVTRAIDAMEARGDATAYAIRAHVESMQTGPEYDIVRFMSLMSEGISAGDTTAIATYQRTVQAINERAKTGAAEAVESRDRLKAAGLWELHRELPTRRTA